MKSKQLWLSAAVAAGAIGAALAGCERRAVEVGLDQGWTPAQVTFWYTAGQGSRLIPQAWLLALEQPGASAPFLDKPYIERFRFLTTSGPLPLGFVPDVQDDQGLPNTSLRWRAGQGTKEPWVGMTCAACHTNDITYRDHTMRVEGGTTLADFQAFLDAFNQALTQTLGDPAKFDRFARKVLGERAAPADRQMLKAALQRYVGDQLRYAAMNATTSRYGYGRNDAFGYIFNKVALVDNPAAPTANEPTAPVSYPFLWNIPQHHRVQWNASAENRPPKPGEFPFDAGALGRNVGEVIGVFGDVAVRPGETPQFHSSTNVPTLAKLEGVLGALRPPRWPREVFGLDERLATEGKDLYAARCAGCHAELSREDVTTRTRPDGKTDLEQSVPLQPLDAKQPSLGTDPLMACNAMTRQADSGLVTGAKTDWGPMPPHAPLNQMLVHMVKGLLPPGPPAPPPEAEPTLPPSMVDLPPGCARFGRHVAYKARPLTGVWATAPYLHNGSVPTLYDLLLPPTQRPAQFNLGTREFDPKRVGFVTAARADNDFVFQAVAANGQPVAGNSNRGHDFGAGLTDHQRWALVEYLKIVGEPVTAPKPKT